MQLYIQGSITLNSLIPKETQNAIIGVLEKETWNGSDFFVDLISISIDSGETGSCFDYALDQIAKLVKEAGSDIKDGYVSYYGDYTGRWEYINGEWADLTAEEAAVRDASAEELFAALALREKATVHIPMDGGRVLALTTEEFDKVRAYVLGKVCD